MSGRLVLRGAVLGLDLPDRLCRSCNHEWRDAESETLLSPGPTP